MFSFETDSLFYIKIFHDTSKIFLKKLFCVTVLHDCFVCMYLYMCVHYLRRPEEGVGRLGTGIDRQLVVVSHQVSA